MHRRVTWLLGVTLWAGSLAGQEPAQEVPPTPPFWEARNFEEWTGAETLQVLTDSPWSRPATLVEPGADVRLGKLRYYAQWYTARTLREALVRLQHLKGRVDSQAEAEFLTTPPGAYQLFVFAGFFTESGGFRVVPPEVFEGMTPEEIEESALLLFSAQEHRWPPDSVEFVYDQETQQLRGIRLTFERARRAVPPGAAREGEVHFICPTRRGSLSARFRLSEMQRHSQPDL